MNVDIVKHIDSLLTIRHIELKKEEEKFKNLRIKGRNIQGKHDGIQYTSILNPTCINIKELKKDIVRLSELKQTHMNMQ